MSEKIISQVSQLEFMQKYLRQIRILCDWSANDMASVLGVTRQTINNIETFKTKMTPTLYLAIGAMLAKRSKQSHILREHLNVYFSRFPKVLVDDKEVSLNVDTLTESWLMAFPDQFAEMTYDHETEDPLTLRLLTQEVCQKGTIFMCPDVLLKPDGIDGVEELCDLCQEYGKHIIVPYKALLEEGHRLSEDALPRLQKLCDEKLISYCGSSSDPELHSLIISQFLRLKHKHRLCLITEDATLAEDVEHLNALKSIPGFAIRTFSMHAGGRLKPWFSQSIVHDTPFSLIESAEERTTVAATSANEESSTTRKQEKKLSPEIASVVNPFSGVLDDWLQL